MTARTIQAVGVGMIFLFSALQRFTGVLDLESGAWNSYEPLVYGFIIAILLLGGNRTHVPRLAVLSVFGLLVLFTVVQLVSDAVVFTTSYRAYCAGVLMVVAVLLLNVRTIVILSCGLPFVACLLAQWGLLQFIVQSGLGLYWIGEPMLVSGLPGVATFTTDAGKWLRAYGPYSHPNILAAVLIPIIALVAARLRHSAPHLIIAGVLCATVVLSYSRAGWAGLVLIVCGVGILSLKESREIQLRLKRLGVVMLIFVGIMSPLIVGRSLDSNDKAVSERYTGSMIAIGMLIEQRPWSGVGIGGYVDALREYAVRGSIPLLTWQYQPVHSVPLLMMVEFGIGWATVGFLLFLLLTGAVARPQLLWLVAVLPLLYFDHAYLTHLAALMSLVIVYSLLCRHVTIDATCHKVRTDPST